MKRVDVAVPCYRYAHFLKECVASILSQPGVEVRVCIIDDASPDDTPAVAAELAASDDRVTVRRHGSNRGHIVTYNEGLDWATGDYLLLLSADDVLVPGALTRAVRVLEAYPQVSFVIGETLKTADPSKVTHNAPASVVFSVVQPLDWIRHFCRTGINFVGDATATAVVRTTAQQRAGHYRADLPHAGDMEMWMRLSMQGAVGRLQTTQACYRQHAGAMHHKYIGIHDLRQRKAAFDAFFNLHADRLSEGRALWRLAHRQLATEAMRNVVQVPARSPAGDPEDWLDFARQTDEAIFAAFTRRWSDLTALARRQAEKI